MQVGTIVGGCGQRVSSDETRIGAVLQDWTERSKGRTSIGAFELADGFDFLATEHPRLVAESAKRLSAADACGKLFALSVGGGAYTSGPGGACSRLRMWEIGFRHRRSAVAGSIAEISAADRAATWVSLGPIDDWFDHVAWDFWLLAISGSRVVVVAATDTD